MPHIGVGFVHKLSLKFWSQLNNISKISKLVGGRTERPVSLPQ